MGLRAMCPPPHVCPGRGTVQGAAPPDELFVGTLQPEWLVHSPDMGPQSLLGPRSSKNVLSREDFLKSIYLNASLQMYFYE